MSDLNPPQKDESLSSPEFVAHYRIIKRLGKGGIVVRQRRRTHPRLWDAAHRRGEAAGLCYRQDFERPDVPED